METMKNFIFTMFIIFTTSPLYLSASTNKNTSFQYGPIKKGMIISLIAQEIRPDDTYSIKKIARYLHEQNKSAFTNADINNIKVGAYLTVPNLKQEKLRKNSYLKQQKNSIQFHTKKGVNEPNKPSVDKTVLKNTIIIEKKQIPIPKLKVSDKNISEKPEPLPIQRDITTDSNYLDLLDSVNIDEESKILMEEQNQEQVFKENDVIKQRLTAIENTLEIQEAQYQEINSQLKQLNIEMLQAVNQVAQLAPITEQLLNLEKSFFSANFQIKLMGTLLFILITSLFFYTRKLSQKIIE